MNPKVQEGDARKINNSTTARYKIFPITLQLSNSSIFTLPQSPPSTSPLSW